MSEPTEQPALETAVHDVTVRICQDCIDLKGEECHVPECVFCFRGMNEAKWLLDKMLICPVIDGVRYVLAGNAALEEIAKADLTPSAPSAAAEAMKWQPISTAPKDKPILGGWYYNKSIWSWGRCEYDRGWYGIHGGRPTHWIPLPVPPDSSALETVKE